MSQTKLLTLSDAVVAYQKDGFKIISKDANGVELEKPKAKSHLLFCGGLVLSLPLLPIGILMMITAVIYYWPFAKPKKVFLQCK